MEILENGYTVNEVRLIREFGYGDLVEHIDVPHSLYRMCVEKAFCENMQGPHVEALRRVYNVLVACKMYRHTEEFEELCKF